MASSWKVEYKQPAANYLEDNGKLVEALFQRIEGLAQTEGAPKEGAHQDDPGVIWWDLENHRVIYERREADKLIVVALIKPL